MRVPGGVQVARHFAEQLSVGHMRGCCWRGYFSEAPQLHVDIVVLRHVLQLVATCYERYMQLDALPLAALGDDEVAAP